MDITLTLKFSYFIELGLGLGLPPCTSIMSSTIVAVKDSGLCSIVKNILREGWRRSLGEGEGGSDDYK